MEFNFADVSALISDTLGEREAIVAGQRRITYGELAERTTRLANYLLSRGLKLHTERSQIAQHESGQDHVALYLYSGPEYVEGMMGCFKARLASFNVNYRYVDEELTYLFKDSTARAVIYHAEFAPLIAAIRDNLPDLSVLIQVADESGNALLPGAVDYEEALASASPEKSSVTPSPDDLYILYTGGTTGSPKGVLWRSHDIFMTSMGGRKAAGAGDYESYEEIKEAVSQSIEMPALVGPPLMHGAAQWGAFTGLAMGQTLVFAGNTKKLDPADFLSTIVRESCMSFSIVGDAFARPLLDEMARGTYDFSKVIVVVSGGAPLSQSHKQELLEFMPHAIIYDGIGSSESGTQGSNVSMKGGKTTTGDFEPVGGSTILSEDMSQVVAADSDELGWFATGGYVPLGYLGAPEKTAATFPVIDGVRYSVPGDRGRFRADGTMDVLGRDSACINSGGEKIFAEEVEHALKQHNSIFDTVVAGRDSDKWGQEVVAIVQLRDGARADEEALLAECAKHLARFKLPKAFIFVDHVERSPSGKPDYRWAKERAST